MLFYSSDLPDLKHLSDFAPTSPRLVKDACLDGPVTAIPPDQIGSNLRIAAGAVEVDSNGNGALRNLFRELQGSPSHHAPVSMQIARTLFCNSHDKILTRHLKELRTAIQLDRRFSKENLLAIYLNRAYLGESGTGVENASQTLFHKSSSNLTTPEAALVAGLIRSPRKDSPFRHPDRALARRNEVLEAMVAAGMLSPAEAQSAMSVPLLE
jgi:membrane carboxypeptidase/penicillin-binding protein